MSGLKTHVSDSESSSDNNDSELSGDEQDNVKVVAGSSREKRNISWCGVKNTKSVSPIFPLRRVVWPPPSTSQSHLRNAYVDPRNLRWGNPEFGSKMQLYCKTGFFLGVYADGKVMGTRDEADPHTFLEIMTGGLLPEHVKIRGMLTNMYVAMDKRGRLYAESDPNAPSAVFIESFQGSYNIYLSRNYAHLGWYIGIKKSGKFKKGPKTKYRQKAVKFLPRRTRIMEGQETPFGSKMQLCCERGYLLRISEDGEISGTQDNLDLYTHLELSSGDDIGTVKIRGQQTGLYICYQENGTLCGVMNPELKGTVFKEDLYGSYNCYECIEYEGWFIGISKKGKVKKGHRTEPGKESTKFVPIRI